MFKLYIGSVLQFSIVVLALIFLVPSKFYLKKFISFLFVAKVHFWCFLLMLFTYGLIVDLMSSAQIDAIVNALWWMLMGSLAFFPIWVMSVLLLFFTKMKINNLIVNGIAMAAVQPVSLFLYAYWITIFCAKAQCYI